MSEHGGQRRMLLDASLLDSYHARLFVGHLAERCQVVMGGSNIIDDEVAIAAKKQSLRQSIRGQKNLPQSHYVAKVLADLEVWKSNYRAAGLWRDWSEQDYLQELIEEDMQENILDLWAKYPTDPEDDHLAETAIMCGLESIGSSNMNMITDDDWRNMMVELRLTHPPALRRKERIIDWMTRRPNAGQEVEWILDMALSVMRPTGSFKSPLLTWARAVHAAFPTLSEKFCAHLQSKPEDELQRQHAQLFSDDLYPVTRQFLHSP